VVVEIDASESSSSSSSSSQGEAEAEKSQGGSGPSPKKRKRSLEEAKVCLSALSPTIDPKRYETYSKHNQNAIKMQ
jgi:hypothetical protein